MICLCDGRGMYLVEVEGERGHTMVVCDCPAGYRRKEFLERSQKERSEALQRALRERARQRKGAR